MRCEACGSTRHNKRIARKHRGASYMRRIWQARRDHAERVHDDFLRFIDALSIAVRQWW